MRATKLPLPNTVILRTLLLERHAIQLAGDAEALSLYRADRGDSDVHKLESPNLRNRLQRRVNR